MYKEDELESMIRVAKKKKLEEAEKEPPGKEERKKEGAAEAKKEELKPKLAEEEKNEEEKKKDEAAEAKKEEPRPKPKPAEEEKKSAPANIDKELQDEIKEMGDKKLFFVFDTKCKGVIFLKVRDELNGIIDPKQVVQNIIQSIVVKKEERTRYPLTPHR